MKYALVTGARDSKMVAAYLPDNYSVLREVEVAGRTAILIGGQDTLGWTFADYVQPRLASGLIWAEEIPVNEMLDLVEKTPA